MEKYFTPQLVEFGKSTKLIKGECGLGAESFSNWSKDGAYWYDIGKCNITNPQENIGTCYVTAKCLTDAPSSLGCQEHGSECFQ